LSASQNVAPSESASLPAHPAGYGDFLLEIKVQIRQRQYRALRAANSDLQAEFPGRNGFSARNLWNMQDFYREYTDKPKLQPLVAEISWAKNLVILARCKDDLGREFYLRATARFGWTKNVLQHQIDNRSYSTRPTTVSEHVAAWGARSKACPWRVRSCKASLGEVVDFDDLTRLRQWMRESAPNNS
ncbi:MAG: DUF1016 N-terminal domain-containing protein, partial [Rhodoferax sp.]|nr:DUF1016 N-terminal domain-containing protein [Rhodoferax sp.]